MGKRLKQIKHSKDLGEFGKKVIDSLIIPVKQHKEEKLEQMRCKVEILEGNIKPRLVDSFISNTNSIEKLVSDIVDKYGEKVQFHITNLYDEKIVARRLLYTGGYDKEDDDKEFFAKRMEIVKKILKMKEEGKTYAEVSPKFAHLAGYSYIEKVYNSTEEEMKQYLRNMYENQSLGKTQNTDILSNNLNTKKDIISNVEPEQK
jgi:hypothetical protein